MYCSLPIKRTTTLAAQAMGNSQHAQGDPKGNGTHGPENVVDPFLLDMGKIWENDDDKHYCKHLSKHIL